MVASRTEMLGKPSSSWVMARSRPYSATASTNQSRWPVISVMMRPRTAGPSRIVVTRVWTRPIGVGHIRRSPLRELLGSADPPDRLDRPPRQMDLHPEARREAADLDPLGSGTVAHEAARDVLQPGD